jgi:hypothetical protein
MSNPLKYSTSTSSNALRKGNVAVGVNNVEYGPTSTTGWYSGVLPTSGNYVIYKTSATGDPDIFAPQSDDELYKFVIMQGGNSSNTTSVGAALAWIATQSDLLAVNNPFSNIVTDGLVLNLDAGEVGSYPTTGTPWYDLSGDGNNGTLTNGPTFNTSGWIEFDGVDDYINGQDSVPLGNPCTVMALINCNSGGSGAGVVFGSSANGSDNWFEINNTSVQLFATRIADTDNFTLSGGTLVCDGTRWYNIAMTIDGATAKIYLDGVEVNSVTQQFTIGDWTGTFDIGRRGKVSQRYFKGSISNVIGYNKSLSEDELRQNYYQAPIVTDGLVLAVDAGNLVSYESGSTAVYNMTGSINGTLMNGVKYNSNNGGYWEFDGVDDYITWGDNFDLVSSNISGFVWGKVNTLDNYTPWIDKLSGGGNYRFHSDVGGRLVLGIRDSNNAYQQTITTSVLSIDTWYNIGFTFNNSTREGKIYLNGRLIRSNTFTIDRGDTTTPLQTGYQSNNEGTLNGALATLSLYNKALTSAEISQNYNAQSSRFI